VIVAVEAGPEDDVSRGRWLGFFDFNGPTLPSHRPEENRFESSRTAQRHLDSVDWSWLQTAGDRVSRPVIPQRTVTVEKAAVKRAALQTLRENSQSPEKSRQRLECGGFSTALGRDAVARDFEQPN